MRMPEPEVPEARTPSVSGRPKRSNTFLGRLRWRQRPGEQDRNVEVNRGAPDVASFADNVPERAVATPAVFSSPGVSQIGRRSRASLAMPEPDFHPDPSSVRPISNYNRPRTPSHPRVDIPPDNSFLYKTRMETWKYLHHTKCRDLRLLQAEELANTRGIRPTLCCLDERAHVTRLLLRKPTTASASLPAECSW